MTVGAAGNQPAGRRGSVAELFEPASSSRPPPSGALWKPDTAFFARIAEELRLRPSEIAYVGDRVDNDVLPAAAAGMFTVLLRRGPWGMIQSTWDEAITADEVAENLDEAVDLILAENGQPVPAGTSRARKPGPLRAAVPTGSRRLDGRRARRGRTARRRHGGRSLGGPTR